MLQLLTNCEVFAPAPLGRRHLLIGGGRILWVGEEAPGRPGPFPVEVVDLEGRRLIPGLVDCHVHLTGGGGEGGFATRVPPVPLSALTRAGVTTVVGVLGTDDTTRDTASLLAAARGLAEEGISAWCLTGGYHLPPVTLTGDVRGDVAHLDRVLGVGEIAISDHRGSHPTVDDLLRVAGDAYVGGMLSGKAGITHLHLGSGKSGLALVREALEKGDLPPRVFHPTHVNRRRALFEEALDLAQRGCPIDVTALPVGEGADARTAADAVRRFHERGLPPDRITVSSDAGGSLPRFDARGALRSMDVGSPALLLGTIGELLTSGMAPEAALAPFTSNPAAVLGLDRKGRIRPGADADLVVLDETGAARDVMAGGRWHVRAGEVVIHGTFEPRGTARAIDARADPGHGPDSDPPLTSPDTSRILE